MPRAADFAKRENFTHFFPVSNIPHFHRAAPQTILSTVGRKTLILCYFSPLAPQSINKRDNFSLTTMLFLVAVIIAVFLSECPVSGVVVTHEELRSGGRGGEGGAAGEGIELIASLYERYRSTLGLPVDLVFVLDRSSSVPVSGWKAMINFVKDILQHFTIDGSETSALTAVITFSTTASIEINDITPIQPPSSLTSPSTGQDGGSSGGPTAARCFLYQRIEESLLGSIPSGYTATSEGLSNAFDVLVNSRSNSKKAVIVLTNGRSNIGPPPVKVSHEIQSLSWNKTWNVSLLGPQVEIYAIGIKGADMIEINSISSDLPHHSLLMPSFNAFQQFERQLTQIVRQEDEQWVNASSSDHCGSASCAFSNSRCMCGTKSGQFSCVCHLGYHLDGAVCKVCPKGYYKSTYDVGPCRVCPQNTTTTSEGATSQQDCVLIAGFRRCPNLTEVAHAKAFSVVGARHDEIANTGVPCVDVTDGNSCHYECDEGFRLSGSPVMICNSSAQWSGVIPTCNVVNCSKLPAFGASSYSNTSFKEIITYLNDSTTYESMIEASCPAGTLAFGETIWTCGRHGVWNKPWNFQCKEVHCSPLVPVPYVRVVPDSCRLGRQNLYSTCSMPCMDGFQQIGPENFTCQYEGRAIWRPDEKNTRCRDIQTPRILCPTSIELTTSGWTDTTLYIDWRSTSVPEVSDNSGNVTYTVHGAPQDDRFRVGTTTLTFEARDAAGNTARCVQNIQVKEKKVEIFGCPENISVEGNTTSGRNVSWAIPRFIDKDGVQLEATCSIPSGHFFTFGIHRVVCYPVTFPSYSCEFKVNVKEPECRLPFQDNLPANGKLICEDIHYNYRRVCHIECIDGYELQIRPTDPVKFFCDWTDTWNLRESWPECYKTRRPNKVQMTFSVALNYTGGSCSTRNRRDLVATFSGAVAGIIESPGKPCPLPNSCRVKQINLSPCTAATHNHAVRKKRDSVSSATDMDFFSVVKSYLQTARMKSTKFKRSADSDSNGRTLTDSPDDLLSVNFVIEAELQLINNRTFVSSADQQKLDYVVYDVYDNISETIKVGGLDRKVNEVWATVKPVNDEDEISVKFLELDCSTGEINVTMATTAATTTTLSNICQNAIRLIFLSCVAALLLTAITCPVGSHFENNTCVPCHLGFYQNLEGQLNCTRCPVNKNTTHVGARNFTECLDPCQSGHYSMTGFEPCSPCPLGTYQNNVQMTHCTECPSNTSTYQTSSSTEQDCKAYCDVDSYGISLGVEPCVPCPIGTHQPMRKQTSCLPCTERSNSSYCPIMTSCTNIECGSNGACVLHNREQLCLCRSGFTGATCEQNIDDCVNSSCQHNTTCVDGVGDYKCACPPSLAGKYCEIEVDECASSPCLNNGSCVDSLNTYICVCPVGFNGSQCQLDINDCQHSPCVRGRCVDAVNGFRCECEAGFSGEFCSKQIDFCTNVACLSGGRCVSQPAGPLCQCPIGYFGVRCNDLIDYCSSVTCQNGGTCQTFIGSYNCKCPLGFVGPDCNISISPDFDLVFRRFSTTDYAVAYLPPISYEHVSVGVWLRTSDVQNYGTIWSYATDNNRVSSADVFTAYDYSNLQLFINGRVVRTNTTLNDGAWHHVCVTWEASRGAWQLYINGSLTRGGVGVATGIGIEGGGQLILGQEQDVVGGGFNERESFLGELSQFVMFDRVLTDTEIIDLARRDSTCRRTAGNVLSWTDFVLNLHGDVLKRNDSLCLDINECISTTACSSNHLQCIDTRGSYACKPCDKTLTQDGRCLPQDSTQTPLPPSQQHCLPSTCSGHGTCRAANRQSTKLTCACEPGFTGKRCERISVTSCTPNPCLNGGVCYVGGGGVEGGIEVWCKCAQSWHGRFCQVNYVASCDVNPCYNNGTCRLLPESEGGGYQCVCPSSSSISSSSSNTTFNSSSTSSIEQEQPSFGANCEMLTACQSLPCHNNGTCVSFGPAYSFSHPIDGYDCVCGSSYSGRNCETLITTTATPSTTILHLQIDFCSNVDCKNGGTCVNFPNKFQCKCHRDYRGDYCTLQRATETRTYHIVVQLDEPFNRLLPHNETFKDNFRQQIHSVLEPITKGSTLISEINKISKGGEGDHVLVDFTLVLTYYLDQSSHPNPEALRQTLEWELRRGRLGTAYSASLDNFLFEENATSLTTILLASIGALILIIILIIIFGFYRWRRALRSKSVPLNRMMMTPVRVNNPTYQSDYPSTQSNGRVEESLYCEPRELLPYSTSEDSDRESDAGGRGEAGGRGGTLPRSCGDGNSTTKSSKSWLFRQMIPLPPKPDEPPLAAGGSNRNSNHSDFHRASPPPPYYPSRQGIGPPPPRLATQPPRKHSYANDPPASDPFSSGGGGGGGGQKGSITESCYFMPLSDEEEADLVTRRASASSPSGATGGSSTGDLTADNPAFDSCTYLLPRCTTTDSNDDVACDRGARIIKPLETVEEASLDQQIDAAETVAVDSDLVLESGLRPGAGPGTGTGSGSGAGSGLGMFEGNSSVNGERGTADKDQMALYAIRRTVSDAEKK